MRESLIPLNDYSVFVRYPSLQNPTDKDKANALETATRIVEKVSKAVGS